MKKGLINRFLTQRSIGTALLSLAIAVLLFNGQALVSAQSPSADRKVPTQYFMTNPEGYNASMWELVRLAMESWQKELGVPFEMEVLDHDQLNSFQKSWLANN